MDAVSIVTVLARELSADPNAQTEICTELSSHIPTNVSDSGQEALTSQMIALLTEPCQLEIVGVPTSADDFKFHVYMFGVDRPIFSFSLGCVGSNPTLSACFYKILCSGYEQSGEKFFRERFVPPDRTRIEYKQFFLNEVFEAHFFRPTLFLHFVQVRISCIDICLGDQYPQMEVYARAHLLLNRVIKAVESKLTEKRHVQSAQMLRVRPETYEILHALRSLEKTPQNVKKLFSAAIANRIRSYASVNTN